MESLDLSVETFPSISYTSIMTDKGTLILTSSLVALIAIVNLGRLLWNIPIIIGSLTLPGWTGGILYLALGLLAAWSFRAFGASPHPGDPSNS